jgi:hypothetical protein
MIKQFAKLLIVASAVGVAAMPAMSVAKTKTPTCHQEAKKAGIKGKAEIKKYVHECLAKRKQAKKAVKKEAKKMEEKK